MKNEISIEDVREGASLSDELCDLLTEVVNKTLEYEKIDKPCYVSITITTPEEIKALNAEYRNVDSVTDVLSFPIVNFLDGTDIDDIGDYVDGKLILGDVVLCAERAKEQSESYGHSFEREMGYLTCHSILHLIGYDHMEEDEREVMRKKEEAVMAMVGLKR